MSVGEEREGKHMVTKTIGIVLVTALVDTKKQQLIGNPDLGGECMIYMF